MSDVLEPMEVLRAVEEVLVEHRAFGDSSYIREQLKLSFIRRLNAIAPRLPAAGHLLEAIRDTELSTRSRLVGNTVIRCAVQHAHLRVEAGAEYGLPIGESDRVFEAAVQHLELGRRGTPFESGDTRLAQLCPGSEHGWIWSNEYPNDLFGSAFRQILEIEYGEQLSTMSKGELGGLRRGADLLLRLLPTLAPDALSHAHLIGCFSNVGAWRGKLSSSQIRMGGTIFLSREMLRDPWCVAEHLLHESLHQKLYDFRHGHSLLDPESAELAARTVTSVWNSPELSGANRWDTHRAFAAFHVYVQLALLALVAEQMAAELASEFGLSRGMIGSRQALDRAHYLGDQLKERCWSELGVAGRRLVDWLRSVLEFLDPTPPPRGATAHLLLDLYVREANRIDGLLAGNGSAAWGLSQRLAPMAKEEVESARRVLSVMGASDEAERLDNLVGCNTDRELGTLFPAVRRSIAALLFDASQSRNHLMVSDSKAVAAHALLRQLVESGSEQLYLIEANVPLGVAEATRRATAEQFPQSCEDDVGRLLRALAAAVPLGGSILEIGTGVGVGTAWIVAGLNDREDVDVLTIEASDRLLKATLDGSWPSYVRFLCADATDVPLIGTFDLIFVDAAPVKYGDISRIVAALCAGGMLVVDDLHAGPLTTESERSEKEALRQSLLSHPELHVVELDWSSGVILVTKSGRTATTGAVERAPTADATALR